MNALALALVLAAGGGTGLESELPPAPLQLFRIAWQRPFVPAPLLDWKPSELGGVVLDSTTGLAVFGTRDGWLHAVRRDGTLAWEVRADGELGPPAIEGDTVYVGTTGGSLLAVSLPDGKERWRWKTGEDLSTRPAVGDGLVFVASRQDAIFALDRRTGAWKWHQRREARTSSGFSIFGSAPAVLGPGGLVFSAFSDGTVAAWDASTGTKRWDRVVAPSGDHVDVDGLAFGEGRLYAAAYSGAVVALDPKSGEVRWTFEAANASAVAFAGGLVVATTPSSVIGISPFDGGALWTAPLGGSPTGAPVSIGKWLLVPAGEGGLRWIESATGRTLRVFDPGTGVSGSPAVNGARVYVLSNGGDLVALDVF